MRATVVGLLGAASSLAFPAIAIAQQAPAERQNGAASALGQVAPTSPASDGNSSGLGDIIVTAQRRSENLQRAAISVTAVTGEAIANRGITNPNQLTQLAPALQITQLGGPYTAYTLRGVTSAGANAFADPAIAVNFNQVYLATPTSAFGLYYDLERVEVLKGPQGTLYGRNATGGAINIIPRRPKLGEYSADLGAEFGNYQLASGHAAINLPIGEKIALRVAGQAITREGFFSDGTGDEHGQAARVSLLLQPTDTLSVVIVGDYSHSYDRGGGATIRTLCGTQACFYGDPYQGLQDQPGAFAPLAPQTRNSFNDSSYGGVSATIAWETELGTLTVIPAYRTSRIRLVSTVPGFYFREFDNPDQTTIEARFASRTDQTLSWLVGGYYIDSAVNGLGNTESAAGRSFSASFYDLTTKSYAGFGQLTLRVAAPFRLTGSLRYSHEEKGSNSTRYSLRNLTGPDPVLPLTPPAGPPALAVDTTRTFESVTWKAGAEWDVGPRSLLYANVGTGFKAGGFYFGVPGANSYNPEKVTAYTIGSKNRFFDNRLQINAEAFWLDYRDQQLSYIKILNGSAVQVTENIGNARIRGAEIEAQFLATSTTLFNVQAQFNDARYRRLVYQTVAPPPASSRCAVNPVTGGFAVDCSGLQVLRAPKWVFSGSVEQTFPLQNGGKVVAYFAGRYESSRQLDLAYIPESVAPSSKRLDASLGYRTEGDRFSITAFIDNITNDAVIAAATVAPSYSVNHVVADTLRPPRTFGVRFAGKF